MTIPKSFKKYWYIFFLLLILMGTIVLRYLTPATPTEKPTATPAPNVYGGVTPGKSQETDVTTAFGTPINTTVDGATKTLEYISDYKTFPTQFVLNGQTVSHSIERVDINQQQKYESLYTSLGSPEAIGYTPQQGDIFPLRIFATKGIAFARNDNGATFEIWRFSPMSISDFFATIGKDVSQNAEETQ